MQDGDGSASSVGMANVVKLRLTVSPNETKALCGRRAMSWKECWSSPIAALDGKEKHALRIFTVIKWSPLPHSFLVKRASIITAQFTFPFLGVVFRHTLRICRENPLTVPDDQRQIGESVFFRTPSVSWNRTSFQCMAQPFV